MVENKHKSHARRKFILLFLALLFCLGISVLLGRYPRPFFISPEDIKTDDLARNIVLNIRLPRIASAFLLGMVLSSAGMVFQMIFRNPLVESGFLGVSSGAAFGASLAIVVLGGSDVAVQLCAVIFAFMGLGASSFLAVRIRMGGWVLRLILAGIAVSALYSAGTGALKYLADPLNQLPDITFWLLGGLWGITWRDVLEFLPVVIPALIIIHFMRWRLNLLSMRDETAFSLVAKPALERFILLTLAVAATAVLTAKAGQISWVGLIIPHISRRLVGSDAQKALPATMLLGGMFVLACDDAARAAFAGEIPLGILTSFTGAAIFLGILMTQKLRIVR